MRNLLSTIVLFTCLIPAPCLGRRQEAHNIILMVADGMGLADVTAARVFQGGPHSPPFTFEQLPEIGYQRTYAADSAVTDSAAAASAWATGIKHQVGQISCGKASSVFSEYSEPPPTILEIAKKLGKATGLVVTSKVTDATPAAFAAHVRSRYCEGEIGRQMIMETGVDVLLGGGIGVNAPREPGLCREYADTPVDAVITQAKAKQYAVVTTKEELLATVASSRQVLGLFGSLGKTPETFHLEESKSYPIAEPTLAEMTEAALSTLAKDPDGFFLVVEGSQIDWRNHNNDTPGMIAEVLGFDAAVTVVEKQLAKWLIDPATRQLSTLLIVTSDHETGGFAITGPIDEYTPKGTIIDCSWICKNHTGVDTVIWSQGPGSEKLGRTVDNTDLFRVMKEAMAP